MIVTTVNSADWTCLARRGMLFAECESVDWWHLSEKDVLRVSAAHAVEEAVIVLDGTVTAQVGDETFSLRSGQVLLLPHRTDAVLSGEATVLTVRVMPSAVSSALPPRIPELVSP